MKKQLILLLMLLLTVAAGAQTFGVKGGYTISRMMVRDGNSIYSSEYKFTSGFNAAGTAEFALSDYFSLMGGIGVTTKGMRMKEENEYDYFGVSGSSSYSYRMRMLNAELPVQARVGFDVGSLRIYGGVGPYVGISLFGRNRSEYHNEYTYLGVTQTEDGVDVEAIEYGENDLHRFDFGGIGTLGVEYNRFLFEASYSHGVANLVGDWGDDEQIQNRNFEFSIGYKFGND